MIEIFRYQTEEGKEPLTEWLQSLRDKQAQAKIRLRLKRLIVPQDFSHYVPLQKRMVASAQLPLKRGSAVKRSTEHFLP
jgi:hypothetical protein